MRNFFPEKKNFAPFICKQNRALRLCIALYIECRNYVATVSLNLQKRPPILRDYPHYVVGEECYFGCHLSFFFCKREILW